MKKKIVIFLLVAAAGAAVVAAFIVVKKKPAFDAVGAASVEDDNILYYTCGMHPSVHITPQAYRSGQTQCPICSMDLIPVFNKKPVNRDQEQMVVISDQEKALAGITTSEVKMLNLFKEIRASGVVAFDAALRSAEQEYLEALAAYDKSLDSQFQDAQARAKEVLEAARTKLRLAGVDDQWLNQIAAAGKADDSLILPQDKMWVYADIYEYESFWPRSGDRADIVAQADPSRVLTGEIKAIEPVLKDNTRTLRVKIYVENTGELLKPNMYVDVYLKSDLGLALAVERDAVLDTGKRRIVYVDMAGQGYMAREVMTGPPAEAIVDGEKIPVYPVSSGLKEGDKVVAKGNFLIDSQSQLGAASSAYSGALGGHKGRGK